MVVYNSKDAVEGGWQQVRSAMTKFACIVVGIEEGTWGGKLVDDDGERITPRQYLEFKCINLQPMEVTEPLTMDVAGKEYSFRINTSDAKNSFWIQKFVASAERLGLLLPEGIINQQVVFGKETMFGKNEKTGEMQPKYDSTNFVIISVAPVGVAAAPAMVAPPAPPLAVAVPMTVAPVAPPIPVAALPVAVAPPITPPIAVAPPIPVVLPVAVIPPAPIPAPVAPVVPIVATTQQEVVNAALPNPMEIALTLAVGKTEAQFRVAAESHPSFVGSPLLAMAKGGLLTNSLVTDGKIVLDAAGIYQLPI